MHNQEVHHSPHFEPFSRSNTNGYLIIGTDGKIIFADQSAGPLKQVPIPEHCRELFAACQPAFEAGFSACLASGQSQARLCLLARGGAVLEVEAYFFLCPVPGNAYQVMVSLQAATPPAVAATPAPAAASPSSFPNWDPLFLRSQTLAQVGNFQFDFEAGRGAWTPAMYQIFRMPEQGQGISFWAFLERIHPDDRNAFLYQSQQAHLTGAALRMELRIFRGDHTPGFIQLAAQPCYDQAGEAFGLFGTVTDISTYKETEQQLQQALTTAENIMNHSLDMLLSIDSQGLVLHANKAFEKILGYDMSDMAGKHYGAYLAPEDLQATAEQLKQVKAGFLTHNFQNHCIRKDGTLVPVVWSAYWSEEEQHYFCVGRNATAIRQAQQQLAASEERFRLLAETGSDMLCLLSPQGQLTYVSSSASRILGYNPEESIGLTPFELMHPEDRPIIQGYFQQIHHTHRLVYPPYRMQAANGEWRWMETTITNYLDHPFVRGFATNCRDITERRQGELKLQESEQRYKSLFEHHPDPVYSLDLEGKFLTANRWVGYLTGYDSHTIIGKNFRELVLPEMLPETLLHFSLCCQGQSRTYKTAVSDSNGKRLDLEVTNIPIIIDGKVTGIYGIAKDITLFQKARRERRHLINRLEQKNHNLEQFAYIVSHNLRAPVANILGLTNLFNSLSEDNALNEEVIVNLQKSAESLDAIIQGLNQILMNRLELDQPCEQVDLALLLDSIQMTLKEDIIRSQALIQVDFTELPSMRTIKSYLHNILLSLIRNALQHQPPLQTPVIKISATRIGNKNCLTIQDNSLNLKRQKDGALHGGRRFDSLGEPKGLSLQLIRTQVEALGGKLVMKAEPGPYSTFKLYLKH